MLSIVATPIGNLGDLSYRAVEVLQAADTILCEDTRTSGVLLSHYGVQSRLESYHMHNEHKKIERLMQRLIVGEDLALLSDAGTPGISDPGFLLIRAARQANIMVNVVPGASALLHAVVGSGLPCDRFIFEGFLPHKKGRKTRIESWIEEDRTVIVYESPHRIAKLITQLYKALGRDRWVAICRELTKKFEEVLRHPLHIHMQNIEMIDRLKGEIVVVIAGKDFTETSDEIV